MKMEAIIYPLVADKILRAVRKPTVIENQTLNITTSIGVAIHPDNGEDADTLMRNADIAMYEAKAKGRDNYQCFSPQMEAARKGKNAAH